MFIDDDFTSYQFSINHMFIRIMAIIDDKEITLGRKLKRLTFIVF